MHNDDVEKRYGVLTDFIRKLTVFFIIIGENASTNIPLNKMDRLRKIAALTCLYGPMHLQLDDYPLYSDKKSDIFETHINSSLRFIHGYTNCMRHTYLITWVSNSSWGMLLSEFIHAVKIIPCPRTKMWSICEQSNTSGDILNVGDNFDDKESFGFSESFFKIAPTNIDKYTKYKLLNLQQENMRQHRNIEINDKIPDEKYQNNKINEKNLMKEIRSVQLTRKVFKIKILCNCKF